MIRHILLPCALLSSLFAAATDNTNETTVAADTLLHVSKAERIVINATTRQTSITVSNLDGSADNFYYQTSSGGRKNYITESRFNWTDIKNVIVTETPELVSVEFCSASDEPQIYSFPFNDPDNRTVKSYIGTKGSDFGIVISNSGSTKWEAITGGIGIGWVTDVNSNMPMDVSMWKSNELTWAMILGVKMTHGRSSLSAGLGVSWRNYVTKGSNYFHKNDEGRIMLTPYTEDMTKRRSRIKVFSLQIPVMYGISFGHHRNWGVEVGPVINFNTGGSIKTQYTIGSHDYSIKTRNINQRTVTIDAMAVVRFKSLGLYARYAPMKVLNSSTGLDFGGLSTGIMVLW